MLSNFYDGIFQIGIFMICSQAIMHFRPNGSYKKYIKMLVSVMILVQVFRPISGLLSSGSQDSFEDRVAWFEEQVKVNMEQVSITTVITDEILNKMTLEEVQSLMASEKLEENTTHISDIPSTYIEEIDINGVDNIKIKIGGNGE